MKVIGIDVGPAKGGHVCDEGSPPQAMEPKELESYLQELRGDVLIAWDAPLTGPPDPDNWTDRWDLTTRPIERFFGNGGSCPAPPGISVRPYCGCPHWTITRRLLGLPRVGRFDKDDLPFTLVTDDRCRPKAGRHVVEVHPAMALWHWCSAANDAGGWKYKKDKKCRAKLAAIMSSRMGKDFCNVTDDELDAWIAWHLARCWLDGDGVMLLGNARTGSFLLPNDPILRKKFAEAYSELAA